mgnify:CR=1 FL=1
MVRTQIQLSEDQAAGLRELAAQRRVSLAELVREGVERVLDAAQAGDRRRKVERAIAAAGRFSSGLTDVASNHDEYLANALLTEQQ